MPWVRIDDKAPEHPKMLRAGPAACWLWVCGLAYCSRNLTDGELTYESVRTFGVPRTVQCVNKLVEEGLWDQTPTGYSIHDYLAYQPSREQVTAKREKTATRVATWKQHHGNVGSNGVSNAKGTPAPVPVPVPSTKNPPNPPPGDSLSKALPPDRTHRRMTVEDAFPDQNDPPDPAAEQVAAVMALWATEYASANLGATFKPHPVLDYAVFKELAETYTDLAHLGKMFRFFFLADNLDPWAKSRSPKCFRKMAPETDAEVRRQR